MSCRFQSLKNFCRVRLPLSLAVIVAVCSVSGLANELAVAADTLTIGSEAPALDVEHWGSDRDEDFSPVTEFQEGKVYVVEFWATWCGPCIKSMPHLAELQGKYSDKGVQIISVSKEDLSEVEEFLKREVPGGKDEQTYAELTSAYCLTTDPDESVYEDYMRAANQRGIPTAFIVGKSGLVEWIGHPLKMDEPLARVVDGDWDRKEFAVSFKKSQERSKVQMDITLLLRKGDAKGALAKLDVFMKELDEDSITFKRSRVMRKSLVLEVGGPEALEAFKSLSAEADNPQSLYRLALGVVKKVKAGKEVEEEMLAAACEVASRAVELYQKGKDKVGTARAMGTHANLLFMCDKLDEAIVVQKAAVELWDNKRLTEFLETLMKAKEKEDV